MSKAQRSKIEQLIDKYISEVPGTSMQVDAAPVADTAAGKLVRKAKEPKPKAMPKKMGRPAKVRKPSSWNDFVREYHSKHKDQDFRSNMKAAALEWKSVKGGMLATAPLSGPIVGAPRPLTTMDQNLPPTLQYSNVSQPMPTVKPEPKKGGRKACGGQLVKTEDAEYFKNKQAELKSVNSAGVLIEQSAPTVVARELDSTHTAAWYKQNFIREMAVYVGEKDITEADADKLESIADKQYWKTYAKIANAYINNPSQELLAEVIPLGGKKRRVRKLAESTPNNQDTTLPDAPATIYTANPSDVVVKRQMKIYEKKAEPNPSSFSAGCLCDYASAKIGQKISEDDLLDMIRTDPKIGGLLIGGFLKANNMKAEPKEKAPKPKKAMNSYFVALKAWNAKKGGKWVVPKKGTAEYNEVMAMK